jgi:HEAT repeat protein
MLTPDDLAIMTEEEKVDFLKSISEADAWQECFEPLYLHLMDDESPSVRKKAMSAFWELAEPCHADMLMRRAENDPDDAVRGKAVSVLGIYIYEAVVNLNLGESLYREVRKFLLDLASDPEEALVVRRNAIEALSFESDEDVHDLIEWAYQHEDREMRMSAVFAMGRSQSSRWFDAILTELDSTEPELRADAVNAAGEACLTEATPKLRMLARDPERSVRLAAIWALAHTGGPGALETIEMCLHTEDEEVRRVARNALDEYHQGAEMDREDDLSDYDDFLPD